ncbi:glyoxylase-like metal-dependent hydrolase (beta-lactamase superfamily II) [Sediminihabitans luteus]|uniref:Glyoxylase-like metal-dependent hydrolase (Beta-lactamase superfamily II) n=1 Tax=Sediminihabitans luteus TaxID=1138585 RepID=A0A2M9CQP7_9CELL|nr:MBL fold metallo-hydrolase [Sediminihabitans luteus]PJJ74168.1 glyoxylase-like metal-dependent hydrolase (beta-lactamase superfamily II) [Sediminihabitans luteus]GII99021.1 MBL fold hydrolase [Sediminihabitans luteus]
MDRTPSRPPVDPGATLVLEQVVSPVFGASCWIVGLRAGGPCVVVDPGARVSERVRDVVSRHGWEPVAVLATHGHLDHVADAAGLSAYYGVPVRLHADDAYRLDDPFGTIDRPGASGTLVAALAAAGLDPADYRAPHDVRTFGTSRSGTSRTGATRPGTAHRGAWRDEPLDLDLDLGLDLDPGFTAADRTGPRALAVRAVHAPGHTQGSTLYLLDDVDASRVGGARVGGARVDVALTGDVLFAGTIGRTDLPGGDPALMQRTLRDVLGHGGTPGAEIDGARAVLPGHGPTSTLAHERRTNPYLR